MKKIGLTGGIGSGKSTVAELFRVLGIPVFNSDFEAKKLQDENKEVRRAIVQLFGNEIYIEGKLDRSKVASIVFSDKKKLDELNAIIHPAVAKAFEEFCNKNSQAPFVLKEAAILFEIGAEKDLDAMIVVSAPDELRINRTMARDGVGEKEVIARINNQMLQQDKINKADYVIENDENRFLIPQVVEVYERILSKR